MCTHAYFRIGSLSATSTFKHSFPAILSNHKYCIASGHSCKSTTFVYTRDKWALLRLVVVNFAGQLQWLKWCCSLMHGRESETGGILKGTGWVCEVRSAELGDFIGWWRTVTLPSPFLITNSWQKSHEFLRRALLGNRTFPFSQQVNCVSDYCCTISMTSLISYNSACVYSRS